MSVFFLFLREKFQWTIKDYALYDSMSIITQVAGTILCLYGLKKLFRVSDSMLAVIAMASYVLDSITKGVAERPVHLYLGKSVELSLVSV